MFPNAKNVLLMKKEPLNPTLHYTASTDVQRQHLHKLQ